MDDFRECSSCDYKKGFHVSFRKTETGSAKIILSCPDCGQSYDLGWTTDMVKSFKAEEGLIY